LLEAVDQRLQRSHEHAESSLEVAANGKIEVSKAARDIERRNRARSSRT
jgi:hypothetical protein